MKNKILFSIILVAAVVLIGPSLIYAKTENGAGQTGSGGQQVQQTTQTSNQGQAPQMQVKNNEETQAGNGAGMGEQERDQQRLQDGTEAGGQQRVQQKEQDDLGGSNNSNGEQRRSQVANAVQQLLQVADSDKTVGEQIRAIAQNQNENYQKVEQSLEKIHNRNQFVKFFLGVNYSEVKTAEDLIAQNKTKIQELEQLKNQVANASEQQKIAEQIKTLQSVNDAAGKAVQDSQKTFSLFGWAFKLFSK